MTVLKIGLSQLFVHCPSPWSSGQLVSDPLLTSRLDIVTSLSRPVCCLCLRQTLISLIASSKIVLSVWSRVCVSVVCLFTVCPKV